MLASRIPSRWPTARRGAILLVVMTLLALFAVIGLGFALYGQNRATAERIRREAVNKPDPFADPTTYALPFVNQFLGQLIYDVPDTGQPTTSALRGHSLARLMYGANPLVSNIVSYNGVGLFNQAGFNVAGITDRRQVVNFSYTQSGNPIVDPEHTGTRTNPFDLPTGTYVGKNGPWTYPDWNNMAVAMMNPLNGQIVVPSFHRPTLFGPLDQSNPNWTTAAGRYMLLRPRPADHLNNGTTEFPYPPMNPDGTVTGDVQNWRFTDGIQKNDSIWMMCNMPIFDYRGKRVTALVAPLILPLDGRINLNVAGNLRGSNATHASNQGFGPWEQNLAAVLQGPNAATEAARVIAWRKGNAQAAVTPDNPSAYPPTDSTITGIPIRGTTHTSAAFAGTVSNPQFPPDYARVDWDGAGDNTRMTLPTGTQSDPTWPPTRYGNSNADEMNFHPSLFNPYVWSRFTQEDAELAVGQGRTLPLSDVVPRLSRYSARPGFFDRGILATLAPDSYAGVYDATTQRRYTNPGGPSNRARSLVTPISNTYRRGSLPLAYPVAYAPGQYTLAGPGAPPTATPQSLDNVLTSPRIGLPPVNLNRNLVDYRADPNQPLNSLDNLTALQDPNPATSVYLRAWFDRQTFAYDIFVRLVVATGAAATYDPVTNILTINPAAQEPDLNALRYLAQIAANIVDYIDDDDISTAFVWNPLDPTNPLDAANFDPAELPNRVVFGTEKPRLVLNEVYAELTNHPNDANAQQAQNPFQVRYWVELLNPGNPQTNPTGFLGDGRVRLYYEGGDDSGMPAGVDISPYQIQIISGQNRLPALTQLSAVNNVTGEPGTIPQIISDFTGTLPALRSVTPVGDNMWGTVQNVGFAVVGPTIDQSEPEPPIFRPNQDPTTMPAIIARPPVNPGGMYYEVAPPTAEADIPNLLEQESNSLVLLRRLACPYLPPSPTNPYITVDIFEGPQNAPPGDGPGIRVRDAVRVGTDSVQPRMPQGGPSCERVQPFFGHPELTAPSNNPVQNPSTPNMRHTLADNNPPHIGAHHSVSAGMNFEWLTHLDRRLINQTELFHVSATPPHELTRRFAIPGGMNGFTAHQHVVPWFLESTRLYRALDILTVKPWMHGVPVGGREPGKVNINMIWDPQVLLALLDPQPANGFTVNDIYDPNDPANLSALWGKLFVGAGPNMFSRSPNFPNVGRTVDEPPASLTTPPPPDRPFKGLGVAAFAPGGALPNGSGLEDTILRTGGGAEPLALLPPTNPDHPYLRDEMLRKLMNNITTVSDTYLVLMTVGFFEVRAEIPENGITRVVLGKEVFREVPGDLRVQYAAVVDRTGLAVTDPTLPTSQQPAQPLWFTELAQSVDAATTTIQVHAHSDGTNVGIFSDGIFYPILPGTALHVGVGDAASGVGDGETMIVAGPGTYHEIESGPIAAGVLELPVTRGAVPRIHPAGSAVSNGIPGNPGPQNDFDVFGGNAWKYKGVVPFVARLEP